MVLTQKKRAEVRILQDAGLQLIGQQSVYTRETNRMLVILISVSTASIFLFSLREDCVHTKHPMAHNTARSSSSNLVNTSYCSTKEIQKLPIMHKAPFFDVLVHWIISVFLGSWHSEKRLRMEFPVILKIPRFILEFILGVVLNVSGVGSKQPCIDIIRNSKDYVNFTKNSY